MTRSTALVTGGTDGVGKQIALGLARTGIQVLVVGRDAARGQAAADFIRRSAGNPGVGFLQSDLSLASEAGRLASHITRAYGTLSYLVHSAGIVRGRRVLTAEGVESNFAVNYLGRFVLTTRLLPLLESSGRAEQPSRILFVSGAARGGRIDFDDVNLTRRFGTLRAVLQFCQANDLLAVELASRFAAMPEQRVRVACLKLGVVQTNIRREFPTWMKWLVPVVFDPLIAISADQAAAGALCLLRGQEDAAGPLFQLIRKFKPVPPPASVQDPEVRRRLWALSARLVAAAAP